MQFQYWLTCLTLFLFLGLCSCSEEKGKMDTCLSEHCPSSFDQRDVVQGFKPGRVPTRITGSTQGYIPSSMTNAERLARGYPLKPPVRRGDNQGYRGENGSGRGLGRRIPSSVPKVTRRGYIRALDSRTGASRGYLSRRAMSGAFYRVLTLQSDAMIVRFQMGQGETSVNQAKLTVENSDFGSFPVLGLIVGRESSSDAIGGGSENYLYIGGVTETPEGAGPTNLPNSYTSATGRPRSVESNIWTVDLDSGHISAAWINPDGSGISPTFWSQDSGAYAGGDIAAFNSKFPNPVIPLTFTFIPL